MKLLGYETPKSQPAWTHWVALLLFPLWRRDDFSLLFQARYRRYLRRSGRPVARTLAHEFFKVANGYWSLAKQVLIDRSYPGLKDRVFIARSASSERKAA